MPMIPKNIANIVIQPESQVGPIDFDVIEE